MFDNFNFPKNAAWFDRTAARTRQFPRAQTPGSLILSNGNEILFGDLRDISIGGVAATMDSRPDLGSVWKVVLKLPDLGDPTSVEAIVVRSESDVRVVALEFTEIAAAYRELIDGLVASKRLEASVGKAVIQWRMR